MTSFMRWPPTANACGILVCGVAVVFLAAEIGQADAALLRRPPHNRAEQAKKSTPKPLKSPLIVISIGSQRVTVFDDGKPVAQAPVSTGMAGHPTPKGVFSVIQKERFHRSNIYSGAPMPFMQRITWSGVAMHAGVLPGYPASHGCIRLPPEFAVRLWGMTRIGARVIIARHDITPFEFERPLPFAAKKTEDSHASLSQPGSAPAMTASAKVYAAKPADLTNRWSSAANGSAGDLVRVADATTLTNDAAAAIETANPPGAMSSKPAKADVAAPATNVEPSDATSAPLAGDAPITVAPAAAAEVAKPGEPAAAAEDVKPNIVLAPYGPERPLRPGPISVFISRKEGELYVRKAFEPLFAVPVTFTDPDLPLGTHVFTAVDFKRENSELRWVAVSLPAEAPKRAGRRGEGHRMGGKAKENAVKEIRVAPTPSAAEALERIKIPADAVRRISELISPGASLIISDQGTSHETGRETDFIVLTH